MKPVTPLVTADVVIAINHPAGPAVVLIERLNPPFGWALPGGFVDVGETVEQAAVREAFEETGLSVTLAGLLGVYSDPRRDPRGHTVTIVYMAEASGIPQPHDDAKSVEIFPLSALPIPLAFDHARILQDYIEKIS